MQEVARSIPLILVVVLLAGCPDPPLLETRLSNDYSFHSNGGSYGYIANPQGVRLSRYFGILDDGNEAWCEGFAWEKNAVVCERSVTIEGESEAQSKDYVLLDTMSGEISIVGRLEAESLWQQKTGETWPTLKTRYFRTWKR